MKRIGIFTKHSMQPKHPRIQMELEVLQAAGYEVEIVCNTANIKGNQGNFTEKLRYYTSFTYFHWPLIHQFSSRLKDFDAVIIYDFALLPLVEKAKSMGKHVVYETIDNNVTYNFHALTQRWAWLKVFEKAVTGKMRRYEQACARKANYVIVNSPALIDYIGSDNIILNLYSSPFETVKLPEKEGQKTAFLYLGEFTTDKGGFEMLEIASKTGNPFFIFGFVKESSLQEAIKKHANVKQVDRMNVKDLLERILTLAEEYRFVGFSLIRPVHLSFATQEANKDIDYLALGIPMVANYRGITKEKVDAGCGVMFDDESGIHSLLNDAVFYHNCKEKSLAYYAKFYAKKKFEEGLLKAVGN